MVLILFDASLQKSVKGNPLRRSGVSIAEPGRMMQDYYVVQLIKTIDSDVGLSDMAETVAAKNHFCSCGACGVGISLCVADVVWRLKTVAFDEVGYVLCFGFAGASVA